MTECLLVACGRHRRSTPATEFFHSQQQSLMHCKWRALLAVTVVLTAVMQILIGCLMLTHREDPAQHQAASALLTISATLSLRPSVDWMRRSWSCIKALRAGESLACELNTLTILLATCRFTRSTCRIKGNESLSVCVHDTKVPQHHAQVYLQDAVCKPLVPGPAHSFGYEVLSPSGRKTSKHRQADKACIYSRGPDPSLAWKFNGDRANLQVQSNERVKTFRQ